MISKNKLLLAFVAVSCFVWVRPPESRTSGGTVFVKKDRTHSKFTDVIVTDIFKLDPSLRYEPVIQFEELLKQRTVPCNETQATIFRKENPDHMKLYGRKKAKSTLETFFRCIEKFQKFADSIRMPVIYCCGFVLGWARQCHSLHGAQDIDAAVPRSFLQKHNASWLLDAAESFGFKLKYYKGLDGIQMTVRNDTDINSPSTVITKVKWKWRGIQLELKVVDYVVPGVIDMDSLPSTFWSRVRVDKEWARTQPVNIGHLSSDTCISFGDVRDQIRVTFYNGVANPNISYPIRRNYEQYLRLTYGEDWKTPKSGASGNPVNCIREPPRLIPLSI